MAERYIGIDLNEKYAMVSYYAKGMSEPGTFSAVTGSEVYKIPLCILEQDGRWQYGEEAKRRANEEGVPCVDGLWKRALAQEKAELSGGVYTASELLFRFLKKLLGLPPQGAGDVLPDKLAIATENMGSEHRKLLQSFADWVGLPSKRLILLDYRECFYYYALSQPAEMHRYDAAMFYYTVGKLIGFRLSCDKKTTPQVVTIEENRYEAIFDDRDKAFAEIAEQSFAGKMISSVYLIGDGFDRGWMEKALAVICRGRRAFMGKNLFCKGACYGAAVKSGQAVWNYVYLGNNELKVNVSLKVEDHGKSEFLSLITAGENWYEAGKECEVILKGEPSVDFWFQPPKSREAVVRSLNLTDLPRREEKTTRLRITAKPLSADKIRFSILDMGFGEIVRSSEKVWEYEITL